MTMQPEGETIRKAVKWVSEEMAYSPGRTRAQLVEEACVRFDLTPKDAEFLSRFLAEREGGEGA